MQTSAAAAPSVLSTGVPASASSNNALYLADNLTDGNPATSWESTNGNLPQWAQVDLGTGATVEEVMLRLPAAGEARTQTLAGQAGSDGSTFTTLAASAERRFDPDEPVEGTDLAAGRTAQASSTEWNTAIRVNDLDIVDPTYSGIMVQTQYIGGQPVNPIEDTVFTDVSITDAQRSGDQYDDRSGYGLWANPMPEAGQGPAVGAVTFDGLTLKNNYRDIENTTSTFTINRD